MTSLNNHPRDNHGSALVVTILLVSVMLMAALILLQRIIPYAKNVRAMNDAAQAYYTARGEVEAGRLGFFYTGGENIQMTFRLPTLFGLLSQTNTIDLFTSEEIGKRENLNTKLSDGTDRQTSETWDVNTVSKVGLELALPYLTRSSRLNRDHIVSSNSPELPLRIKLFATDALPTYFGTSKRDPEYHTLNPRNSGGLRFDFRGINTNADFGLLFKFYGTAPASAELTVKIQYSGEDGAGNQVVKTFTVTEDLDSNSFVLTGRSKEGVTQDIDATGGVTIGDPPRTLAEFLAANNCEDATTCSLTLTLNNPTMTPVDFQLISNGGTSPLSLPDLNAVVVGDGLSDNKLYYQRAIELIPTPQDI